MQASALRMIFLSPRMARHLNTLVTGSSALPLAGEASSSAPWSALTRMAYTQLSCRTATAFQQSRKQESASELQPPWFIPHPLRLSLCQVSGLVQRGLL